MKKSLSLLVAIAMVFSMFATVAAAATDTQSKYEELKEAGIFEGRQGGDPALDSEMTRAEFATVLFRLAGLQPSPATFDDVPESHWASGYIGAAQKEGLVEGVGNNKYAPSKNVTKQELIKVAVTFLGLEVDPSATVAGKASAWAQPYVAAALAAGLITPQDDYTIPALRSFLVDVTYEVYQEVQGIAKVTKAEAISATKVVVTFSDGGEVEVELEEPLQLGKNTITVTYNDREYKVDVNFEATAATAKQVGAKTIEVTFNKPIDDSKVKFAVKNGIISRDVAKFSVSEDKKKAVLELTTRLQTGESVVTISGIETDDIEAKFQAEDERVTELKFKSDKLALKSLTDFTEVKVGYQILNQFGEEASSSGTLTFFISKAGASATASNGVLTITTSSSNPFYLSETVLISGHINMSTYVVTFSETLTVGQPATLDSIEFKGVYHEDNKSLDTKANFEDFYILIEAKDQYGNKLDASAVDSSAIISVANMTIFTVNGVVDNKGPNKDQVAIQLDDPVVSPGFDGTNTIRIQSYSGKLFTYDVEVPKASTVTRLALSAPAQVVANNDGSVKIPFVAEDQFGNRVTKYSDLKGQIEPLAASAGGSLELKEDYVTKEGYLEYTLPTNLNNQYAHPVFLSVRVVSTNEIATVQFNIEKAWVAESISGLKDVNSELALNAYVTIEPKHVVVKDNYGRDKNLEDLFSKGYKVVFEAVDGQFDTIENTTATELSLANDKITFQGKAKGSERVKVQLVNSANEVVYSYEGFIFNVVDSNAFESYEVEDLPKISNKSAAHAVELKVYGKRSNGTKVLLPKTGAYSVTATDGLRYTGDGKITAEAIDDDDINGTSKGELKAKVVVTIFATAETIEKEVIVTDEDLRVTAIELQDVKDGNGNTLLKAENGVLKGAANNINMANIFSALKIKDQFGVEMGTLTAADFNASFSNLNDYDDDGLLQLIGQNGQAANTLDVTGVETGDSFQVVFTSVQTGVSINVKVVAE